MESNYTNIKLPPHFFAIPRPKVNRRFTFLYFFWGETFPKEWIKSCRALNMTHVSYALMMKECKNHKLTLLSGKIRKYWEYALINVWQLLYIKLLSNKSLDLLLQSSCKPNDSRLEWHHHHLAQSGIKEQIPIWISWQGFYRAIEIKFQESRIKLW